MSYHGDFAEDATVSILFGTSDAAGGAIAPSDAFDPADIKIFKDGSATPKTTANGISIASPFASMVGIHQLVIDTSDDTGDAGFWVAGSRYQVVLDPDTETVDTQTIRAPLGDFTIGDLPRSSDVQVAVELAIEAKHLDHFVILQGIGAGSGITDFSINSVSGIATDDLVDNLLLHINSGQVRRIIDANISGSTLTGTVTPPWNNTPGLGSEFIVLPGLKDWATAARGEPAQGAPPASAALAEKIDWVYSYLINEKRQDATELELVSQDGTTVIAKFPVSDDGTTTTIGKMVSGA